MSEELHASVGAVLADMPVIPANVRTLVLNRLSDISDAVTKNLLQMGTTFIAFEDLGHENVVLTMCVSQHFAHLEISTADEAIVVSNGYDFLIKDGAVEAVVIPCQKNQLVDHIALLADHRATDTALHQIEEARELMQSNPVFKNI